MSDSNKSVTTIVQGVVVIAALGVAALAIFTLVNQKAAPAPVVAPAPAPAPVAPVKEKVIERSTQFVVMDTDRIAELVAGKVEAEVVKKLEKHVGAAAPVKAAPTAAKPAPTAAKKPTAPAKPEKKVDRSPRKPTSSFSKAPTFGEAPAGAWPTAFGPQPAKGPKDAPVVVFVLSDFQCPVCKRAAEGLAPMLDKWPDKVRWVFWNNPLDMHRRARPAAKASYAAFRQGKFWEYHDKLFANSRALQESDLLGYAKELGLDVEKFKKDMADPAVDFVLDGNMRVAELLEARGTPAFIINGRKQVGWGSASGIQSMVERELREVQPMLDKGKSPMDVRKERAEANSSRYPEALEPYVKHMLEGAVPPDVLKK